MINLLIAVLGVAAGSMQVMGYDICLDREMIPCHEHPLPVFTLGPALEVPQEVLSEIVTTAAPNTHLQHFQPEERGNLTYDGHRLVAHVDAHSGETTVFPKYENLVPGNNFQHENVDR